MKPGNCPDKGFVFEVEGDPTALFERGNVSFLLASMHMLCMIFVCAW